MKRHSLKSTKLFTLLIVVAVGCEKDRANDPPVATTRQAWEDTGYCWGEPSNTGEIACQAQASEPECLEFNPIDEYSQPIFPISPCSWDGSSCHITNAACHNQGNHARCDKAGATGIGYGNCRWLPDPACIGSLTPACTAYGINEATCTSLSKMGCQWSSGDNFCVPKAECSDLRFSEDYTPVINAATPTVAYCNWNGTACTGSIAIPCSVHGNSDETTCNNLSPIDCQWLDGSCIPETDCETLDQVACEAAISNNLPQIPRCTSTFNSIPGTCIGSPYSGGESQCFANTFKEACESVGLYDGNNHALFPEPLCAWDGVECHVKANVCTAQTDEHRCAYVTPPFYAFGLCSWISN